MKRPNIIHREIAVEVVIHAPSMAVAEAALEDIRLAVQQSVKPVTLRRRHNVTVTVGEAYLD